MKILICGSRNWSDLHPVWLTVAGWKESLLRQDDGEELVIVHGDAAGADTCAEQVANDLGVVTIPVPAQWSTYGRAAGPMRNQQMLDEHEITAVYAFRSSGKSNGTDDMTRRAVEAKIPVYLTSQGC